MPSDASHHDLTANLRAISIHELLVRTSPWMAVFVLFTRSQFGLEDAIRLAGIYYLAVVVFEVPSGWASDRFGRAITLRIVALAWIGCFTCFLLGVDRFGVIALGQVLLAVGYASLSGTDVTFHFDTLEALGQADGYADRQAKVTAQGMLAGALGVLVGGAVGLIDLRWAFALSLGLAVVQFVVALRFTEPPHRATADPILPQVGASLGYLRDIPLAWIFGYGVAMVVLEHVAFTLLQPWLTEVLGQRSDDLGATPMFVGVTMAIIAVVGAIWAQSSVGLARRFGLRATLVGLGALSAFIVTTMALFQHLAVLGLVILRSAQGAAAPILISAAVAPVVAQHRRATLLSLNSLAGRFVWGTLLLVISTDTADDVARTLGRFALVSWALVLVTLITAIAVHRRHGPAPI